ncbi:MAG: NAD-dependent epimerase/dehydratase family protein [Caulobacteraceae bacterium]
MRFLITGSAGFIGFHLARRLLEEGHEVAGLDGFTPYYDVGLKRARHALLKDFPAFSEEILMLEDAAALQRVAEAHRPEVIVHLAAQAGVRHSVEDPRAYIESNVVGTFNVLEAARALDVRHLLIASTSSVYGDRADVPFHENDRVAFPLSLYAATKGAGELLSHSYSHLWGLPTTAFRFFTVYGPWGRPDMALFKFVHGILNGQAIDVYNDGEMERDFTYVSDLVEAVRRLVDRPPEQGKPVAGDSLSPAAPWRLVNIGRGAPVKLMDFIAETERALGRRAIVNFQAMQPGDVKRTFADATLLETLTGYRPSTPLSEGVAAFCAWYEAYFGPTAPSKGDQKVSGSRISRET